MESRPPVEDWAIDFDLFYPQWSENPYRSKERRRRVGSGTLAAMQLLRTVTQGSRKKRIYDKPLTPFERLKACDGVDPKQIARLEKLKATLNPFALKRSIERKLRRVLQSAKRIPQKALFKRKPNSSRCPQL